MVAPETGRIAEDPPEQPRGEPLVLVSERIGRFFVAGDASRDRLESTDDQRPAPLAAVLHAVALARQCWARQTA